MSLDLRSRAQSHLAQAQVLLDAGLPADALAEADACLRLNPGDLKARLVRARAAMACHKPVVALESLADDVDDDPSPVDDIAHSQSQSPDAPTAGDAPDASNAVPPVAGDAPAMETVEVAFLRAQAMMLAGYHELAMPLLTRLARDFPDDPRPHRLLAVLHERRHAPAQAAGALWEVLRLSPGDQPARRRLVGLLERDLPGVAAKLIEDAPQADEDPAARLLLARLLARAERGWDAETLYRELMSACPDEPAVWLEASRLADRRGACDQAIARLDRALAVAEDERRAQVMDQIARVHLHAGRTGQAGRWWFRLSREDRTDARAWAGLLVCALAEDRPELVRRSRHRLDRQADRTERDALLSELWPHVAVGQAVRDALGGPRKAQPASASPLDDLLDAAVTTLERHVAERPRHADAHLHLAQAHRYRGDHNQAAMEVHAALVINPGYTAALRVAQDLSADPS